MEEIENLRDHIFWNEFAAMLQVEYLMKYYKSSKTLFGELITDYPKIKEGIKNRNWSSVTYMLHCFYLVHYLSQKK